ncbi:putative electron transport complex protein RnfE [Selenomonas ruminantium subsp. lactilytica TAM6421]|uniref:Ion-translocating oxidoreductase complex subunit E n=2 Tax=Selenomonas ruminantium TaxID=971 RepID=A0A1M6TWD4_SELRU|nr:electron transport complex subunit E [Selenomonas ruminantium]BAL82091.1 putative electron transport complex protein RnfE [Selenomonas ruminantium subsp. lactilytica TAM6421]SHK61249.1 electron transport complex protein RnfE [Selenomonas ruminantium]
MKEHWQIFSKGLIAENPIFILALSLCPALAVTTTVINGLTMGLTVTFVITTNNVVVSIVRKWVNPKVRVPVYITSIATIVTVAQLVLQAYFPVLYKAMGIYLALVVVFAIILARAEVFASKNGVFKSFLDGFGMGCGFTLAMLTIAVIRELIGAGTILGVPVFGEGYNPMLMMILPPGAFILIGYLVAACKTWNAKQEEKARIAELKAGKEA